MSNIVLIGMPGAGKSTIGVILAKSLGYDFLDSDLVIQKKYGKKLIEIINEKGLDGFLEIEDEVLSKINCENTVIATGGSAVYGEKAMENLKSNGKAVYLKLTAEEIEKRVNNIKTRGIVMKAGQTLREVFSDREPYYERYADITVDCNNTTLEECIAKIIEKLK